MRYSRDGEGRHRAVALEDDRAYVYAMSSLAAAPRIFACFDQPDLKAPYRVAVTAPPDWTVLGNGAAEQTAPGSWRLAETEPLATYFVTLVAGPYHSVRAEHDGISLGLHCRDSLARHLDKDAEELFAVTAACFDEYHRLFGIRYPFGEYHQAFVPEFTAGAMENPGCVTFSDDLVFKAPATDRLRARRANVVAHEMAHQWFGDLVTMRWWDDLWLNESFAEYMGYRVTSGVTAFDDVWVEFAHETKAWGMAADQRSSTHPVAGNGARDAQEALSDFDGISYSKGCAALRQLAAYLGDDAFLGGVVDHLTTHTYGNATLADLLGAWERASGKDVRRWSEAWLRTSGLDTLSSALGDAGEVVVHRASGSPGGPPRPHAVTVTAYGTDGRLHDSASVVIEGDVTPVPLRGVDGGGLVLPDSADETWAKIALGDGSVAAVGGLLARIDDPLARAVVWSALREALLDARLDPAAHLEVVEQALPTEVDLALEGVLGGVTGAGAISEVGRYYSLPQSAVLERVVRGILEAAEPGSNRQLIASRAVLALTSDDDLLRGWLSGDAAPQGVVRDELFRWQAMRALCEHGQAGPGDIEAERQRDRSSQGALHALECRASLPDPVTKEEAWLSLTTDASLSNYEAYALARYFFRPRQVDLTAPYAERYFAEIPATAEFRNGWMVERVAALGFPRYSVSADTVARAEAAAGSTTLASGVRRAIADATDDLRRVLVSRATFGR